MNGQSTISQLGQDKLSFWHLLRHEIIYLMWAGVEASLIGAFSVGLLRWSRLWSIAGLWLLLLCFILIPFNLSRIMTFLHLPLRRQQRLYVAGLAVVTILAIRIMMYPDFRLDPRWMIELGRDTFTAGNPNWFRPIALAALIAFCWSRGLALASREIEIESMGRLMRIGGLLLAPLAIAIAGRQLAVRIAPFIILYFFFMLLSIALTRAEEISSHRFSQGFAMTPRWLAAVTAATALLLITAIFLGAAAGEDNIATLRIWLGPLWAAIFFAGTAIFSVSLFIARPLLRAVAYFIDNLYLLIQRALKTVINPEDLENLNNLGAQQAVEQIIGNEEIAQPPDIPFQLGRALTIIVVILFALGITWLIRRAFRVRAFALEADGGMAQGNALYRPKSGGIRSWLDQFSMIRQRRAAASIKRIYQNMCLLAAENGFPRSESETPFEYMHTIEPVWGNNMSDVELITKAFARIRYGEYPETSAELSTIKDAWKRLKRTVIQD